MSPESPAPWEPGIQMTGALGGNLGSLLYGDVSVMFQIKKIVIVFLFLL